LCGGPDSDGSELLAVAASMLRDGYSPDLSPLCGGPADRLQRIPPYVFDTSSRFWFDGGVADVELIAAPAMAVPVAEPEQRAQVPASREDELLATIADVGGYPVAQLGRSSRLAEDLGYDSLLQLRLIHRLRAEYPQLARVTAAEVLPRIRNVGDLVDFVGQWFEGAGLRPDDRRDEPAQELIP
jgi:acyl carrier protein